MRCAIEPSVRLVRHGDLARGDRAQCLAVAVEQLAVLVHDGLGELVDHVGAGGGVHPADVPVEALVDEELAPGHRAVGIQPGVAGHLQFGAEEERGVRVDQQQRVAVGGELRRDGDAVGAGRLDPARTHLDLRQRRVAGLCRRTPRARFSFTRSMSPPMLPSVKRQRHPRLEVGDHARMHVRMRGEVVVEPVGPGVHQRLAASRALRVERLQLDRIDEQLLPQVEPDRRLALRPRPCARARAGSWSRRG